MKYNFESFVEASKLSSMDYWFPLTKDLPIPQPRTIPVLSMSSDKWCNFLDDPTTLDKAFKEVLHCADKMRYPLFIRTDQSSAKHSYVDTCYVKDRDQLGKNIYRLIEENIMCNLNVQTLYLRSFIELNSAFTAFNKMPIAPERRYFIKDGEILCHHPYWPIDAIKDPDHENWKKRLKYINVQEACEILALTRFATIISMAVPSTWSVDFAQAKDSTWYFIDMADARLSWHPTDCPNYKKLSIKEPSPTTPKCNIEINKIDDKITKGNNYD